jgi:AcrR family transcriptional regulator
MYQYFPDKRGIFLALHDRHVQEIGRLVERSLIAHADAPLEVLMRGLVEALIDAHAADPELHQLLLTAAPYRGEGARNLETRLRGALRLAITSRAPQLSGDLDRRLFVLTHMVDALARGAVLGRPAKLSLAAAKEEAVRAVMGYLKARDES